MNKHIQRAKLFLLCLGALWLAACHQTVSGQSVQQQPVKITYWHRMTGSWAKSQQKLIKEFNQSQTKYQVVAKSWRSYAALNKAINRAKKTSTLPVLGQTPYTNIGDYASAGILEPLDTFMNQGKTALSHQQLVDINPSFLATGNYNNKQYALPFSISTRVLFYNQDLLDRYHLQVPLTWNELIATAKKAQAFGLIPISVDHSFDMELESMTYDADSQLVDNTYHANWNTVATQKAVTAFTQAISGGLIKVAAKNQYFANSFEQQQTLFGIGSSATIPELLTKVPKMNWGTTVLPRYQGHSTNVLAGNDLVLFKGSSKQEQQGAWAFMRFMLQKENVAQWSLETGYVPVTKSATKSNRYQQHLKKWPQFNGPIKAVNSSFSSVTFKGYQRYRQQLLKTITALQNDPNKQAELLKEMQQKTEAILQVKAQN